MFCGESINEQCHKLRHFNELIYIYVEHYVFIVVIFYATHILNSIIDNSTNTHQKLTCVYHMCPGIRTRSMEKLPTTATFDKCIELATYGDGDVVTI